MPEITEDEKPFDIPSNWKWVRFGEIVYFNIGKTPPRAEEIWWGNDFPWVCIADIIDGGYINKTKENVSNLAISEKFKNNISKKGTLIMSFKLSIGKVSILNIDAVHNEAIISIYPFINTDNILRNYLFNILPYICQYGETKNAIKGKRLNSYSINNLIIPLPPLEEQKRIVQKLEQILPYIEQYEKDWNEVETLNKDFPDKLKKSLLQYAIEGKLVEQREEEGTAEELFKQIQEEKQKLIEEKKLKKEKPLPEITDNEKPFDIPSNWKWVRFGEIVYFNIGKTPPRAEVEWWGKDFPWICIADIIDGGYINKTKGNVSNLAISEKFKNNISKKGTLIMSFKLSIGKVSILNIDAVHNEAIISIYPFINTDNILRNYLFNILPYICQYGETKNAIKGKTLNSKSINNLTIPLPPLEEQKRIVEKLEQLLPLCEQLK